MRVVNYLLIAILMFSLAGIVSAQNTSLNCQYKELKETQEYVQALYDKEGNRYVNAAEIKNIAGSSVGSPSFDTVNKIPYILKLRVTYDISHSGGSRWPNNEQTLEIEPLGKASIVNSGASGILWGTTIIDNIRISYITNSELEVKSERIKKEVCRLCGDTECINDGQNCAEDKQCGSGTCNILNLCGKERVVDCPKGTKNCNNQSCLSVYTKEIGEKYSCEFECKTGYGENGVCKTSTKEKATKVVFILIFLVVVVTVIYWILINKDPIEIVRELK